MARQVAAASTRLIAASSQNIGRQLPVAASSTPPSTGAAMGATLDKVMNSENSRAAATPLAMSAATARVRQRPEHQLAHDQADDVRGQGELHRRLAHAEVGGELRERRQVQVHRQRTERGETTKEHGQHYEPPSGEGLLDK